MTLACDGQLYSVHKFVLSMCSEYFQNILDKVDCKNPVIILKDIKKVDIESLLNYMYNGEVKVVHGDLENLIKGIYTSLKMVIKMYLHFF